MPFEFLEINKCFLININSLDFMDSALVTVIDLTSALKG